VNFRILLHGFVTVSEHSAPSFGNIPDNILVSIKGRIICYYYARKSNTPNPIEVRQVAKNRRITSLVKPNTALPFLKYRYIGDVGILVYLNTRTFRHTSKGSILN
jgi:hypothetical protein